MENRPREALQILTVGPEPFTAEDFLLARARAMGKTIALPLIIPIIRSPEPPSDSLDRAFRNMEEIPYSRPPARRHKGYQEPDQHNNMQANRAAAVRSAKAKKKATAEMKKKARRRG